MNFFSKFLGCLYKYLDSLRTIFFLNWIHASFLKFCDCYHLYIFFHDVYCIVFSGKCISNYLIIFLLVWSHTVVALVIISRFSSTEFHAVCVDSWLTTWRTFCPICKRDARTSTGDLPASESTPLLSSGSMPSAFSSVHSSLATSSPIQIVPLLRSAALSSPCSSRETASVIQIPPGSFHSPSTSQARSRSSTHYMLQSVKTCSRSPTISVSRSSVDLRNAASSHMFRASYLISPNSLGPPSLSSPLNSQYASPFVPSSSNGSPIYIGSSSMQQFNLHCSHSAASISPFASARSLPGCWCKSCHAALPRIGMHSASVGKGCL